jgi:hypothetical protein
MWLFLQAESFASISPRQPDACSTLDDRYWAADFSTYYYLHLRQKSQHRACLAHRVVCLFARRRSRLGGNAGTNF